MILLAYILKILLFLKHFTIYWTFNAMSKMWLQQITEFKDKINRHLFHTWATLTKKNKVPHSRSHTPRFDGLYFYNSLFTFIFLILLGPWDIFLIDNLFSAADMGFNCFKLLINCRLLSLSIFKTLVEIHPFPVVQSKKKGAILLVAK